MTADFICRPTGFISRRAFDEDALERTQDFVRRWSPDGGVSYREIVRKQYSSSPPDNYRELGDYVVELDG